MTMHIKEVETVMSIAVSIVKRKDEPRDEYWHKLMRAFRDVVFEAHPMVVALAVQYMNEHEISMAELKHELFGFEDFEFEAFKKGIRPIVMAYIGGKHPSVELARLSDPMMGPRFLDKKLH